MASNLDLVFANLVVKFRRIPFQAYLIRNVTTTCSKRIPKIKSNLAIAKGCSLFMILYESWGSGFSIKSHPPNPFVFYGYSQVTISIFRFYFIIGPFIFMFSHAGLATFGVLVMYSPFKDYFYFLYVFILAVPCEYGFYFSASSSCTWWLVVCGFALVPSYRFRHT